MYTNLEMLKLVFQIAWKRWAPTSDEDPFNKFLKSMIWNFGNMRLVSSKKSPDGQCWQSGKRWWWWGGHQIKLNVGGSKTIGFNDGLKTSGKSTLRFFFEIWNSDGGY